MYMFRIRRVILIIFIGFLVGANLACNDSRDIILEHPYKTYCILGEFNEWENSCEQNKYIFQPTSITDERVSEVYDQIKNSTLLYILSIDFSIFEEATWSFEYTIGDMKEVLNGALAFKVIRVEKDHTDYINYWIPSRESGEVKNLTSNQLFLPSYFEDDIGSGSWNDNAYVLKKSNYYIVLAYQDETYSIGIIEKEKD